MKKKISSLLVFFAIIFCFSANAICDSISSYTAMDLKRGEYKAFTMSPSDINEISCYYYADGRNAILEWREGSWYFYFFRKYPDMMMDIYFTWGNYRPWYKIGTTKTIDIITQRMMLPFNQGRYKFFIKAYDNTSFGGPEGAQLAVPQLIIR